MNIRIVDEAEAKKMLHARKTAYQEVYNAVDALEPGKAIVIELEDAKTASRMASALSSARCYKRKKGH